MRTIPRWGRATVATAWLFMLGAAGGLSWLGSRIALLLVPLVLTLFYGHLFFHGLRLTETGSYGIVLWNRSRQGERRRAAASGVLSGFAPRLAVDLLLGAILALLLASFARSGWPGQWLLGAEIFFPLGLLFHRSLFYLVGMVDDGVGRLALALPRAIFFSASMSLYCFMIVIGGRRLALLI